MFASSSAQTNSFVGVNDWSDVPSSDSPLRRRLVQGAAALRNLATVVLGVVAWSAATAGLAMLAVVSAETAHDLALNDQGRGGRRRVDTPADCLA